MIVRKQGSFSGHWSPEREGQIVAGGRQPNVTFRVFDVEVAEEQFTLTAHSSLKRQFDVISGAHPIGIIRPAHAYKRGAFIECTAPIPERA